MPRLGALLILLSATAYSAAGDPVAGKAYLEKTAFIPGFWPRSAYDRLWKQFSPAPSARPADYERTVTDYYGLHAAPYPNDGLPMGLRPAPYVLGKGIGLDCMMCHGGSLMGTSYVGLGNASLDIHTLFEDLYKAGNIPANLPFQFSQTRGTNEAGAFSVYLLGYRNDDLTMRDTFRDLGLHDDSCEDVPAWWLLKKKRTMYHVGATDSSSVRSLMQFMMHPLSPPSDFHKAEAKFVDVLAYIKSIEPPKYPFRIDAALADQGREVFNDSCARCHGTYGPAGTYPNKVIPLTEIGTDRKRFDNIGSTFGEAYARSWFAQETPPKPIRPTVGYQAPPLDGIWATAPYFHNGSVPTLAGVLDSSRRPAVFTRSFRTNEADYDKDAIGWKVTKTEPPGPGASPRERRMIYDTTKPGRGNQGHTYGDALSDADRRAVIEYLKTL